MKNRTKQQFKYLIKHEFSQLLIKNGLSLWNVTYRYADKDSQCRDNSSTAFYIEVDPRYYMIILWTYPIVYRDYKKDGDLDFIRSLLSHEIAHVFIEPLRRKAIARYINEEELTDELEKLTETFGKYIFDRTFNKKK